MMQITILLFFSFSASNPFLMLVQWHFQFLVNSLHNPVICVPWKAQKMVLMGNDFSNNTFNNLKVVQIFRWIWMYRIKQRMIFYPLSYVNFFFNPFPFMIALGEGSSHRRKYGCLVNCSQWEGFCWFSFSVIDTELFIFFLSFLPPKHILHWTSP